MSEPKYRDEEWLRSKYIVEGKSTQQIADEYGYGSTTICTWLEKHNIPKRSLSESVSKAKNPDKPYADLAWLKEEYVKKKKSIQQIADELGVSTQPITYWLDKHGIETRPAGWNTKELNHKPGPWDDPNWLRSEYVDASKSTTDIAEEQGVSSSLIRARLEKFGIERRPSGTKGKHWLESRTYTDESWLREQYVKKNKATTKIASECNVSADTILLWLKKHDIETRSGALRGEKHHWWNGGGCDVYGKGWNQRKKRSVRERDGYECVDCGTTQDEHKAEQGEKLHVHHLLKARNVDDPEERNAAENLVTLCRDCHRKWERVSEAGIKPQLEAF